MRIVARGCALSLLLLLFAACGGEASPTAAPTASAPTSNAPVAQIATATSLAAATPTVAAPDTVMPDATELAPEVERELDGDARPFHGPTGVALDADGNLYVVDAGNSRVVKFDPQGQPLLTFGKKGTGEGEFQWFDENTGYLAVDGQGNVYVADTNNARVQKFDSQGHFLAAFTEPFKSEPKPHLPGPLTGDRAGNLYVLAYADNDYALIHLDANGTENAAFREQVKASGLKDPLSIGMDASGHVLVVTLLGAVYVLNADGGLVKRFALGPTGGSFTTPTGIVQDAAGNYYVTDGPNDRVVKFDAAGKSLGAWGSQGKDPGQFFRPYGIALDASGQLYVAEYVNDRVQVFRLP